MRAGSKLPTADEILHGVMADFRQANKGRPVCEQDEARLWADALVGACAMYKAMRNVVATWKRGEIDETDFAAWWDGLRDGLLAALNEQVGG